ncbi:MAG: hypothetical protein IJW29_00940 [Clostridia bacterium]|nr:hypothetical protein [Clostridia bacterium]
MQLNNLKRSALTGALIYTVFGVLAGLLLLLVPTSFLLWLVFVIMGIVTVISNIPGVIMGLMSINRLSGVITLILSALSVVMGVMMIFWHEEVLMIVVGIYMILLPILTVLLAKDHGAQLKAEPPKIIIGLVLVLLGPAGTLDVLFDVAGWVVIALSALYLASVIVSLRKLQNTPGTRVFVDHDGDGTVDAVYVDTTGDGKADTSTKYKENK